MLLKGKEYEFSFSDCETVEKWEVAQEGLKKDVDSIKSKKYEKYSENIKDLCNASRKYIDTIFGEGTSQDLLGDKYDYIEHCEVVAEITDEVNKQEEDINKFATKYSANRAARRSKK